MKFIIHGAAREVGRSCIELITDTNKRFLLDAGVKLSEQGTEFPMPIQNPSEISAVFLSHAHLDHNGYLPMLDHQGMKCPIFATAATKALTKIILSDAFKIGRLRHEPLGYEEGDIEKAIGFTRRVKIDEKGKIDNLKFEYFDAGHIPGAASILLEADGKKIFYTGDINHNETRLLNMAEKGYMDHDIDVLITEATYGNREHANRQQTEKEFLAEIEETVERGGSALVPVFAVGRAQEIMLVLSKTDFGVPIYLDGMAKEATDLILDFPKTIKNAEELRKAYSKVRLVKGRIQRKNIAKGQGIFITTSGMMTGGPVIDYAKEMFNDPRSSILMTGYQGMHTNGRMLLDTGYIFIDGWKTKVTCKVRQFDFSAHSGQSGLRKMIKEMVPKQIIINHGDEAAAEDMHEWAQALDIKSINPMLGEKITL